MRRLRGKRLRPEALAVKVCDIGIMDLCALNIDNALDWVRRIGDEESPPSDAVGSPTVLNAREMTIARQILKEIEERLRFLADIGLDYLTLDRTAQTLSGGEAQRIRLATQIGSGLTGVLYVCDEPTVGLHPVDDIRLIETLKRLQELGNTVVVVEHDQAVMQAADYVVDLGPGAGEHGGYVVVTGTIQDVMDYPDSITGNYLSGIRVIPVPQRRRRPGDRYLVIKGAKENNLKDVDVKIPWACWSA